MADYDVPILVGGKVNKSVIPTLVAGDAGLNATAFKSVGTAAGTVAAGDDARFAGIGGGGSTTLNGLTDVTVATPVNGQVLAYNSTSGQWTNTTNAATGWEVLVRVTADGATNVAPAIQTVLDALGTSTHSYVVVVEGLTKGSVYLNSKVRITTSNTTVSFRAPVILGTGIDPDGKGGLSITGTVAGTTTISSGAVRGSSKVTVASATGITAGMMVRIVDTEVPNGGSTAGWKNEMAEVIDVSGTLVYLDHPLHQSFTGTITLERVNAVTNSGFDGVNATFDGQQVAGNLFPFKMMYARNCFYRNIIAKGTLTDSWSRECINLRYSYRCIVENCAVSVGWDYNVGSEYDYAYSADGATQCIWSNCWSSNVRHNFTLDKGSAGCIFVGCVADNVLDSGFDIHGNWVRDVTYSACHASASETYASQDGQREGFAAGNTNYKSGVQDILYTGCTARGFGPYTKAQGGAGEGIGFSVVDGVANVTYQGNKIVDCQHGIFVTSHEGVPITNIGIYNCEFTRIGNTAGVNSLPIFIDAGAAPQDVNGMVIDGNRFVNCNGMTSIRIWGKVANTITDFVVSNNVFNRSTLVGSVHTIDARYVDNLVINNNVFSKTRRGVALLGCVGAVVVKNVFQALIDSGTAKDTILDSGGNSGFVFAQNAIVGYQPTSWSTAPSSTGAYVDFMGAKKNYATSGRPSAVVSGAGAQYFDTTLGIPAWSDGAVWRDSTGTAV